MANRNWAKCRQCGEIIESRHRHDFVTCGCGAISIDGGRSYWRAVAEDLGDIIRLDDDGTELIKPGDGGDESGVPA